MSAFAPLTSPRTSDKDGALDSDYVLGKRARRSDPFRSTSRQDKGVESSLGTRAPSPDTNTTLKSDLTTQDESEAYEADRDLGDDTSLDFEMDDRLNRMVAILARRESIELLTLLLQARPADRDIRLYSFLVASPAHLHTFARLVSDDALILKDGHLTPSSLAERLVLGTAES